MLQDTICVRVSYVCMYMCVYVCVCMCVRMFVCMRVYFQCMVSTATVEIHRFAFI